MTCDAETAQREFDRFVDLMDLDLDPVHMDEEDRKGLEKNKRLFIEAIKSGHVTVDESGQPTVHLKLPTKKLSSITFYEPEGATFLSMDQKKKGQDMSKMFSMIQDMAKLDEGDLATVKNRDLKVIQAIGLLFLA